MQRIRTRTIRDTFLTQVSSDLRLVSTHETPIPDKCGQGGLGPNSVINMISGQDHDIPM